MNDKEYTSPPLWPLRFFRWFCHPSYVEDIEGDLYERFTLLVEELGLKKARRRFALEVLLLFRPGIIRSVNNPILLIHPGMIKHNLLISYRGFLRDKTTFLINLIGLSTGLACVLLIYLWVNDEMSMDKFHENDSQLYQVMTNYHGEHGIETWEHTPLPLAKAMIAEMPEVESATLLNQQFDPEGNISRGDTSFRSNRVFSDKRFFEIFSYNLIEGNSKQVLADKNKIVISEDLALKLFQSTSEAIGQTIEWGTAYRKNVLQVSGVFADLPTRSTKQFDVVMHVDLMVEEDPPAAHWNSTAVKTYVVLREGTDLQGFNEQIELYMWSKVPDRKTNKLFAQQYSSKYLYGRYEDGAQVGGRISYVSLFSVIALFILLIACINFMNLSTAQASKKMKEIGVKKTMGATRKGLIWQFLTESTLMVVLSCFAAFGIAFLILPQYNRITGKILELSLDFRPSLGIIAIILFTGLLAGSYPAFYLSGFKPVSILKGKLKASFGEQWVRKGLVVFQFALSVIFLVGVWVVNEQMQYTQSKNLGYDRDNIISFYRPRYDVDPEAFLAKLKDIPGVDEASTMVGDLLHVYGYNYGYKWSGEPSDEDIVFKTPNIWYDAIETFGMEVLEGRSFSRAYKDNYTKVIINETARKQMGLEDPIGQRISKGGLDQEIIGVVADFHFGSLHQKVEPLIFRMPRGGWGRNTMVKIQAGTEQATIKAIEEHYKAFHAASPFEFTFMDTEYQRLYEAESRVATLSKYFCLLAIIISCLGLFGLAAFTAQRRSKEIGIRKILGSSVWGIVRLLSTDFTRMVVVGILIALPISYFITQRWLNNFAYKIDLEWWFFIGSAISTLLIAWSVVGLQTLRTAQLNPAECLRDE